MEAINRLVSESLARHGFDRPLDYRRLHWSRWFRCDSLHSLLSVPSKPGVFAVAEEVMNLAPSHTHIGADAPSAGSGQAPVPPAEQSSARSVWDRVSDPVRPSEARQALAASTTAESSESNSGQPQSRMLAVTQFFEADDMAFVLDRMLTHQNPMRARLTSGSYFVRYVVIDDQPQRRSICAALNQWIANSGEKVSGIGAHFATDAHVAHAAMDAHVATGASPVPRSEASGPGTGLDLPASTSIKISTAPNLDSGAAANIHCPQPLPSGF